MVQSYPDLAGDAMPALLKALQDKYWVVWWATVKGITAVVQSSPDLAVDTMPALLEVLKDEYWEVCWATVKH